MKTYPDYAPAKIIKRGNAKGSVINYWPTRYPYSAEAQARMTDCAARLAKMRRSKKRREASRS